ncbi:hypothetical protein IscW_ISCW014015 [Ixodes scapularis]|uniref:Uncharacterized protein n=1 Tax=Ixodes scapularis TaxID=6945 RepID=B7QGU9_IXOSC|nr:hypothetical protein IscW_ISCW014015 [Ixodes scapularis]|eukprot:XP_002414406.1 hypothetical protein IscW_ISCW014015 [Ixodes scapularis]
MMDGEPTQDTQSGILEAVRPTFGVRVHPGVRGRPGRRLRGLVHFLCVGSLRRGYRRRGGTAQRAGERGSPGNRRGQRREGGKASLADRLGQEILREEDVLEKCERRHAVHQHGRRPGGTENEFEGMRNTLWGTQVHAV